MEAELSAIENQRMLRKEKLFNTSLMALVIERNKNLTSDDIAHALFAAGFRQIAEKE